MPRKPKIVWSWKEKKFVTQKKKVKKWIPRAERNPGGRPATKPPKNEELAAFGAAVRATRRKKFMSQTELGEMFGLHQVHIGKIERGMQQPTTMKRKILIEKLRIWVETNKSVLDCQREEGSALNDLNRLIKENQNARNEPQ